MKIKLLIYFFVVSFLYPAISIGQEQIIYSDVGKIQQIGNKAEILEDKSNSLSIDQVLKSKDFKQSTQQVPNLQLSRSAFWIKFSITNQTQVDNLVLELAYPTIDSVTFISVNAQGNYSIVKTGEFVPYYKREYKYQNYIFDMDLLHGETKIFLLKISAVDPIEVPLSIGTPKSILESDITRDMIFGLYAGIILVMFFYNLFIYFTVRDRQYLYYIFYILTVGLTQACLQGYAARFFYPNSAYLSNLMMVIVPALSGITAIFFLVDFMQVKAYTPKLYLVIIVTLFVYFIAILLGLFGYYNLAAQVLQSNVGILAIIVLITGYIIARKGYRPAIFFMVAWSIFLASVIVFVLRNFGVLPYNNLTYYSLEIGSALEVVLLSFALADKINVFRKEKEESQAQTLLALQENEKIIREQNTALEIKVNERTVELKSTNDDLSKTLQDLKEKESQLVESEKMASLGQLTAGIAHEINNPINFVTSNVKPLKRDVEMLLEVVQTMEDVNKADIPLSEKQKQIDEYKAEIDFDYLKQEIGQLLDGINDGASRTAEIVKGLRIFSRLDEDDLKKADINEGLDSTLIITNNLMNNHIEVVKQYGNLPLVECYPGKLNQVFLNIISNAAYAILKKFEDKKGGKLTITTMQNDGKVVIKIADNGTGMDEKTQKKLFEPFFTTKEVGEGTGLGLSIVYNTINKHNGSISVASTLGEGTVFTIELPVDH